MPSKSGTFELFRYQLLPVDRFLQANLITGVSSIEELISRKNEFFYEALDGAKNFSSGRYQSITKKLYQDPDFFLFRVAVNRSIHVETKDFTDDVVENWPSLLVAVCLLGQALHHPFDTLLRGTGAYVGSPGLVAIAPPEGVSEEIEPLLR